MTARGPSAKRERRVASIVRLRERIDDDAHIEDYKNSDSIGRVTLGELCLYYRDLGKKYYVPYPYIDRAFCRISECQPDDSPAYYYYRLILMHGEKEFANLIFNKEEEVDTILQKLPERNPDIKIGFQAPPDGKRKARFS